jgi:hypothetical protein
VFGVIPECNFRYGVGKWRPYDWIFKTDVSLVGIWTSGAIADFGKKIANDHIMCDETPSHRRHLVTCLVKNQKQEKE